MHIFASAPKHWKPYLCHWRQIWSLTTLWYSNVMTQCYRESFLKLKQLARCRR